jgi:hypothetical protein
MHVDAEDHRPLAHPQAIHRPRAGRLTLGFLILRKGFLKVVGATIQAALDRGHRVVLIWDPVEPKLGEAVAEADLDAWPGAARVVWSRHTALLPVLQSVEIEALLAPSLHYVLSTSIGGEAIAALGRAGIGLYSVDYMFETVTSEPEAQRVIDVTFYMSRFQQELHQRLYAHRFAALGSPTSLAARSSVSGSTMLDQLAIVDRAAVRKRYGLAPDQPVVVFMSLKMAVPDAWRHLVWGSSPRGWRALKAVASGRVRWLPEILRGNGYVSLVEAIREFCVRTGAALVVKSREKNADPRFLRQVADVFVYDEAVYPYTSIELMAIADLCIHFESGAVLEAAFAGVPSLSIAVSQEHLREYSSFDEVYGGRASTLQNFPGVVWHDDPPTAIDRLRRATFEDFRLDPVAHRCYVEKFLGFSDTESSGRVLRTIERALSGSGPS